MTTPPTNPPPFDNGPYPPPQAGSPYQPQPGYAPMVGPARPGVVTAAAVLSFVCGAFTLFYAALAGIVGTVAAYLTSACDASHSQCLDLPGVSSWGAGFVVIAVALFIAAGLLIAGGVSALKGKDGRLIVIAAGIMIVCYGLWIVATSIANFFALVGIAIPILIIAFILGRESKMWFQAKGARTF